jgi:hypothetical protein
MGNRWMTLLGKLSTTYCKATWRLVPTVENSTKSDAVNWEHMPRFWSKMGKTSSCVILLTFTDTYYERSSAGKQIPQWDKLGTSKQAHPPILQSKTSIRSESRT